MFGFVFLFPLSFAYLIASKKLYDIDFIVRRIVLTGFISLVPTGLIVLIACLFFKAAVTLNAVLALFVLVLVIQTTILYLLEFFTNKLEPVMFPHKHQLQSSLKKLTRNLSVNFNLRELRDVMLLDVVQTFQVHGGAIVFQYPDKLELISEGEIDTAEVEALINDGVLDHPNYSIYEVNRHDEFTSYLILTQKKSKTLIGVEEQQWLNIIISYLAVSLENVYLIRKLSLEVQRLAAQIPNEEAASELIWFRKLMFELQESERVRIATELHDTTMQDLFFLKERFAQLIEKYALSADDKAQLQGFIDYIDIINANLRQSCFELHPHLLREIGLVGTIEELVSFEEAVSSFSLEFRSIRKDLIESQDMEMKRHVFRMVQELINNAKKHSQAKSVWLSLEAGNQILRLEYEDNGVGFDMNQPKEKEIGNSGIGMEQMKGRVLSLNGRFQLESSIGAGMRFTATIPLKEGKTA
ncbi:MAG: hypothetical protein J7639_33370 [Paenibacillaceae bacterium]|nr:hypothetical protein [Paenibacillaceae bacterium]